MQIPLTNSLRCCSGLTGKMIQDFSAEIVKQGKCRKGQNNSLKRSRRQNNGIKDSRAFLSVVFTPHISIHMASLLLEIQKMWFGFPIFNEQIDQYVLLADRKQNVSIIWYVNRHTAILYTAWTNILVSAGNPFIASIDLDDRNESLATWVRFIVEAVRCFFIQLHDVFFPLYAIFKPCCLPHCMYVQCELFMGKNPSRICQHMHNHW